MASLPSAYFSFMTDLRDNNRRDWFDANKGVFDRDVKAPFHHLIETLIDAIRTYEPMLQQTAKDAIFRLHRDTRFSKDKTPYKTAMGAVISLGGRKAMGYPGFYIEAGADGVTVGGGAYMPDKEQLASIRSLLADEPGVLAGLLQAPDFVACYGALRGDRNRILPAEFKAAAAAEPLIANKQFYYMGDVAVAEVTATDAIPAIMRRYTAALPVQEYLRRAF